MDDDEDWPPTKVEVVCVGLGRTGTTSLAIAFDMLGHHSYHDDQLLELAFHDDEDDEEMFEEVRVSSVAAKVTSRKKGCILVLCRSIVVMYDDHCTIISSSISSFRSSRFAPSASLLTLRFNADWKERLRRVVPNQCRNCSKIQCKSNLDCESQPRELRQELGQASTCVHRLVATNSVQVVCAGSGVLSNVRGRGEGGKNEASRIAK